MIPAKQSTAKTIMVGPVLDADGVAVTGGVVADFKISKNGAAPAALDGSATLTHRHTGFYSLALTANDLDTVGSAQVTIDDTVNACPKENLIVVEEAVYDALFAASANGFAGAAGSSTVAFSNTSIATVTNLTNLPTIPANWLTAAGTAADFGTEMRTVLHGADVALDLDANGRIRIVDGTGAGELDTLSGTVLLRAATQASIDAIEADTNELQTDWTNGGRLDLLIDSLLAATVLAEGTADSGSTTTMVDAARTEGDADYWKGRVILFTSGTIAGQCAIIEDFNAGTDTFTFAPALTQAVGTNTYKILAHVSAWDETLAEHLASGTTGNALNAAGSAGDPWATALPGAYGAGTAGKIVGDNLNATVGSRSSHSAADVWASGTRTLTALGFTLAAADLAADTITAAKVAADVSTEIRNAITGGAYALDTDANGRVRVVDGTGAGEISLTSGLLDWNAAWDAEVQSEVNDGLVAFFTSSAALVDAILDEDMTAHQTQGTLGQAIGDPTTGPSLHEANIAGWGSISDTTPTVSNFDTTLTNANLYWSDIEVTFRAGAANAGVTRVLTTYTNTNGNMTFDETWPVTPVNGDAFFINTKHSHSKTQIAQTFLNTDATVYTVNRTLGAIINDLEDGGRLDLLFDAAATAASLATAQADLDILTGTDGATLATSQANYAPLKPTIAGRTLDVAIGGEAAIDLDNTTGTLGTLQFDNAFFTADLFASDAIAASKVATDAVNEIRNAITGGAYALNTSATGSVRVVDGTLTDEIDLASGLVGVQAASVRTAVGLAAANLDTQLSDLPTAAENAAALLDLTDGIETGVTPRNLLRGVGAALFGLVTGAGTGSEIFKGAGQASGGTTRLTYTVDSSGNRSAVTLNL